MKLKCLLAALIFSHSTMADQSESQSNEGAAKIDESILSTNAALKDYKEIYVNRPQNRAFAQSPNGHWNWRSDRVSIEIAKEDALAACNKHVKKNEPRCEVINVNGEWIAPQQSPSLIEK